MVKLWSDHDVDDGDADEMINYTINMLNKLNCIKMKKMKMKDEIWKWKWTFQLSKSNDDYVSHSSKGL